MSEAEQLEQAIAALEEQRSLLGDAVVEAALASMREKLAALQSSQGAEQRKLVTVLFADLAGFTAMAEKMDPEDVREVLAAYFTRWTEVIERHTGQVEKFIGDAVMAVFGLTIAQEDDPERAIRAALEMQTALDALNQSFEHSRGVQLQMRVGINTGPVVVSLLGERKGQDFVVVGDTVNLTSRLQAAAPVGGILISQDTYRHVRGIFSVQVLDPVSVKGKQEPIQVYLVQAAKPRAFRPETRGVEGIETRLIGRQAELKRLQNALNDAVENRASTILTVAGEAGLGKSRLLLEFENWMELLPEKIYYFRGRATSAMQNLPYSLLRDVFSFRFQIQDSDPPEVVHEKMERGIADAFVSQAEPSLEQVLSGLGQTAVKESRTVEIENTWMMPPVQRSQLRAHFIGRMLGFDFSGSPYLRGVQGDAKQFLDRALSYLAAYFSAMAGRQPVVMMLEDLHWADDSSLDALDRLVTALAQQSRPLLVACAARPAFFERRPHWGEGRATHARLDLAPLTRDESRRLVEEILHKVEDLPVSLREMVADNSDGNPFYMEELVKMLIEDGVIIKSEERWHVAPDRLAEVRIPPTLTGVLQARFDSLTHGERIALQRASVIGRVFWNTAVDFLGQQTQKGRGQPTPPVDVSLAALRTREMIYQREQSAFEETQEYLFKNSLLRDVTYESVLKRDRRIYHEFTAHWLEGVTQRSQRAGEYAALIAGHYEQAGDLDIAQVWYKQAGLRASAQFANVEAIRYLSRALSLTPADNDAERYSLLLAREKVYDLQGARRRQSLDLDALAALAEKLDDDRRRTEVLLRRSHYHLNRSNTLRTIVLAQDAIQLAKTLGDVESQASGHLHWGAALWHHGDYKGAQAPLEAGLALARQAGALGLEADCLRNLGVVAEAQARYAESLDYFEQSLKIYRQLDDRRGEGMALNSIGIIQFTQGDLDAARQHYEESLQIKREIGNRAGEANTLNNLGVTAYAQGDHIAAREYFEQAQILYNETGEKNGTYAVLYEIAGVAIYQGNYAEAAPVLEESLKHLEEMGDLSAQSEALSRLSLLSHQQGDNQAALEYSRQAQRLAEQSGHRDDAAWALQCKGNALAGLGRFDEAASVFSQVLELRHERGQHHLEPELRAGLAHALLQQGRLEQARQHIQAALQRLEAQPIQGMHDPFRVYLTCYQVLCAAQDARAHTVLEKAFHLLQSQAARFTDDAQRCIYLENPASNRELLAEWEKHNQPPPNEE